MIPMSEADFQKRITDLCALLGLAWHHETDARRSKAGFPDLVIVGCAGAGVLFAELKTDTGRVRPEQTWAADRLARHRDTDQGARRTMTNLVTDPARVREALAYYDEHGHRATVRALNVNHDALRRWIHFRAQNGPDWPTLEFEAEWRRTKAARDRHAAQMASIRKRRIINGGQPLLKDATGTRRRIQALMRLGWSASAIAARGHWSTAAGVLKLTNLPTCTEPNAAAIARIYDQLCMTPGPSIQTRNRATRAGYPPPLAWDDIDTDVDPTYDADPADDELDEAVILRLLAGDTGVASTKPERVETMRRWRSWGRSEKSLCTIHRWKDGRYVPRPKAPAWGAHMAPMVAALAATTRVEVAA